MSFQFFNKKASLATRKKIVIFFLLLFSCSFLFLAKSVRAQQTITGGIQGMQPFQTTWAVSSPTVVGTDVSTEKQTWTETVWKWLQKAGSGAFQKTLATVLNKIAYDTANYIGSGGQGQSPLFVKNSLKDYLNQTWDEARGQFIESFASNLMSDNQNMTCQNQLDACYKKCDDAAGINQKSVGQAVVAGQTSLGTIEQSDVATVAIDCYTQCDKATTDCAAHNANSSYGSVTPSFNVCSPSSVEAKLRISLGLVEQSRPKSPDCTYSQMISTWETDINKKLADFHDPKFLNNFAQFFDPQSNDLGIYITAKADMLGQANLSAEAKKNDYIAKNGWIDVRDISGALKGIPNEASREADMAAKARQDALGKTTGDIFVDTANLFLNQLYVTSFNRLLQNLLAKNPSNNTSASSAEAAPQYGETSLQESTSQLLKVNFGVRADYNVLADLAICPDSKNPGPDNCVIDEGLMQAISDKKTVGEAIKDGTLHGYWKITNDEAGDSYHNSYSIRNIEILIKYRILPLGWAEAARLISESGTGKKATLSDLVSCFDPHDTYTDYSDGFVKGQTAWCEGLVDPNWVLKAPLSYCKKEGFSSQLLNKSINAGFGTSTPSTLSITRADSYCADNETCIKEKSNGSCDNYGYCNEEKRTWSFDSDSCEAINNTCQSFTNTTSGNTASYLENTLDYGNCDSGSAGCRQYSLFGAYVASTSKVNWDNSQSIYFNKSLATCSQSDEACTELMRFKSTWGSNLVMDSDFRDDQAGDNNGSSVMLNDWPLINNNPAAIVKADEANVPDGGLLLKLTAPVNPPQTAAGIKSSADHSLLPADFQIIPGQAYSLSADVFLQNGDQVELAIGDPSAGFSTSTTVQGSWQHLNVIRQATSGYSEPTFSIIGSAGASNVLFYLKNIKFELSEWETGASAYGSFKVYEKLLPPYLESSCYVDTTGAVKDYNLKTNAPAVCSNYARKCNQAEVGCELFSSVNDKFAVPAKVVSSDYCVADCLGYDAYIAKGSAFSSPYAENLIPAKSTNCSAAAAGCSEFTNLDSLSQGGEQREYYTFLKQCIKPSQTQCDNFYSWEGQAGGQQLQVYSFEKKADGSIYEVPNDSSSCDATTYNYPINDPRYNPDCRQFYDKAGNVSYHLTANTVTCSDNCHAYRLSDKNIDVTITEASACTASSQHWSASTNSCYSCLGGGTWDNNHQACIYQAIPGEGKTCGASENGCREYNGSSGSNVHVVAAYDFENSLNDWYSNCSAGISSSTIANSKNGHSLNYHDSNPGTCGALGSSDPTFGQPAFSFPLIKQILAGDNVAAQHKVANIVQTGAAYTVKFTARAASDTNLKIYFYNNTATAPAKAYFNASSSLVVKGGNGWNIYQANLANLDHEISPDEILVISADKDFYLDNFVLSEITDRYYLIKNSSQVPPRCSYDIFNVYQGPEYNLGCSKYSDRANAEHDLNRFSQMCASSAVGCEQMIDTANSSDYRPSYWLNGTSTTICDISNPNCHKVEGDRAIYAVYDASKQCTSGNKGCSRLGQGQGGSLVTSWLDVFAKNDPDRYATNLCSQKNAGCEEWTSSDNTQNYFKDPGSGTCVYRNSNGSAVVGKAWYKVPVKRCDRDESGVIDGSEIGGAICTSNDDCGGKTCLIDNNDYLCSVSYLKTIGLGGANNQIPTPDKEAGLCSATASGCSEYIDPVSSFSINLVNNPGFETGSDGLIVGWGSSADQWTSPLNSNQQIIRLESNKLYSFNITASSNSSLSPVTLDLLDGGRVLQADNTFSDATTSLVITSGQPGSSPVGINQPIIFNSLRNKLARISGGSSQKNIEVKELAINYQLAENIDKTSCNAKVKFDTGCVLFNERTIAGKYGLTPLKYDAYNTPDAPNGSPAQACSDSSPYCQANQLIKAHPDRVCAKWLDCITYTKDPTTNKKTCYSYGQCDRLDDQGDCSNFVTNVSTSTAFNPQNDKNASGYSLVGNYNLSLMKEVGSKLYTSADGQAPLECQTTIDFASPTATSCPANWNDPTPKNSAKLIKEPKGAPTDYPAEGLEYLQVPANLQVSLMNSANPLTITGTGTNFYLNYLVNTRHDGSASGLKAKVIITDQNNVVLKDESNNTPLIFYSESTNGWKRIVNRFYLGTKRPQQIKIFLSSNTKDKTDNSLIYFDDINIEPVLDLGNNNYAARDCRLYPTADSQACLNSDNNVVKNGLEGYCLDYDPANPGVCLLWYPLDRIAGATDKIKTKGYQGKFPLDYCTEANGNFTIAEKRETYYQGCNSFGGYCVDPGAANDGSRNDYNSCNGNTNYWTFYFEFTCHDGNDCCHNTWCIPKTTNSIYVKATHLTTDSAITDGKTFPGLTGLIGYGANITRSDTGCGTEGSSLTVYLKNWSYYSSDGWYYPYSGGNDATKLRIYDFETSQLLSLPNSTSDPVYQLACNRFNSVVDSGGNNMAWSGRISSPVSPATSTPPFFYQEASTWSLGLSSSTYNFYHYGRETGEIPFGAASWPANFSLSDQTSRVPFRDSSKSNIYAGQPYGCVGQSCSMIGSCSNDPSKYCLATSTGSDFISRETCNPGSSTGGICIPLWSKQVPNSTSTNKAILSNIFLKSYNSYTFFPGTGYKESGATFNSSILSNDKIGRINQCNLNVRDKNNPNLFCAVYPTLSNVSLYYADNTGQINPTGLGNTFNISQRGIYRLEFNTLVDPEQQPLDRIEINWGDGNTQVITDQDQKPAAPHSVYHYYSEAQTANIQIQIFDNWGQFDRNY